MEFLVLFNGSIGLAIAANRRSCYAMAVIELGQAVAERVASGR